tara:strand:+ start:437 stop:646 length:210 start_codon:yes stop_codon:yes gene_type:complete
MCRSIKKLRRPEEPATDVEVHEAALQYVRKISGYRVPSKANEQSLNDAVSELAIASTQLLATLRTGARA